MYPANPPLMWRRRQIGTQRHPIVHKLVNLCRR
jgi:hypothetical protein